MRRGLWLLVLAVVAAALGAASARAAGTTTTGTTTTTTTAPTPTYAPLASSTLPAGCVGAGAAALVAPGRPAIALGTPAVNLGPSGYPSSGSVLGFGSSTASGTTCASRAVTLTSVSLFGGTVTASSVQATNGRGTAAGVTVNGSAVAAAPGETVPVDDWGELMFGATIGRVTGPLVLRLYQAHGGLSAGTAVVLAFAASALPPTRPEHRRAMRHEGTPPGSSRSQDHPAGTQARPSQRPLPDYPATSSPFTKSGALTDAAQDNTVVSIALHYLGVPYQWGGASPKTGFDCSGLVMYVFAQLGVPLEHFAAAQWHAPGGVWVAPNRLRPGDLVFFTGSDGTRKAPGHVGIYVDDGYIIDAPHTGSFVRIDSLNDPQLANQYVGARRFVGVALHARHLLRRTARSAPPLLAGFLTPLGGDRLGGSLGTLGAAAALPRTGPPRGWSWAGAAAGALLLVMVGGGLGVARRPSAGEFQAR